ncbi:MAG: phosphotransferase [Chloroflexi bacterium]|nr:phosphotransferase [Chloroflexota bacterium]
MSRDEGDFFATIRRLDHAATPARLAARWGGAPASLELVNDGINAVYRFRAGGETTYLRITHASLRDEADLHGSLVYQRRLLAGGAPVCEPLPALDGEWVAAAQQGEERFLATACRHAPGQPLPEVLLPAEQWTCWGRLMGAVHRASESFQSPPGVRYLTWREVWAELGDLLEPDDAIGRREYDAIGAWFARLPETPPDFGLTHFDFRAGNVLWDGEMMTLIDFDEPVWHWYAADVARPFLELRDLPDEDQRAARGRFLEGYRAVRPLDEFWVERLPWFTRMKRMDFYAWNYANWDPRAGDREAWRKREQGFMDVQESK